MSAFIKACFIAVPLLVAAPASTANGNNSPTFPTAYKEAPTNIIKYGDLDLLLKQTVLETGRSDHKPARKPTVSTGTRVSYDNIKPSRLEGNRILFHQQTDELARVSAELRDAMLEIPSKINFATVSKDEQLAYWLNLHNIIIYNQLANHYPVTDLKPLFANCKSKKSQYCARSYNLGGQMVSLKDIRDHVVNNWDDPLVIYGFYMGAVGTPNARAGAYEGSHVWQDLRENAVDFIHSVRGSRVRSSTKLNVSTYYTSFPAYFPNLKEDLLTHIRAYSEPHYANQLRNITKVKTGLNDWNIADLYNGHLKDPTGAGNVHSVDPRSKRLDNATPIHAQRLLADIQKRNKNRKATVGIERMQDAKLAESTSKQRLN